jgi:YHS domain-containing protein
MTRIRGVSDPVCGMKVDRARAVRKDFAGEAFYFCSEHCLHAFELDREGSNVGLADGEGAPSGQAGDARAEGVNSSTSHAARA